MMTRHRRFFSLHRDLRIEPLESRQLLASLLLGISPSSISEGAGAGAATGTVIRDQDDLSEPLEVTLDSSDTTAARVPATVTIPANETSVDFDIDVLDDAVVDGTQTVTIRAAASWGPPAGDPQPDPAFGTVGVVSTPLMNNISPQWLDLEIQDDGKIIALGRKAGTSDAWQVVRLHPDGSFDETFGTGGSVTTTFTDESRVQPTGIILHDDGKITAVGQSSFVWLLATYNPDGSPDVNFAGDGQTIISLPVPTLVFDGVANPDGSVTLVGQDWDDGISVLLGRVKADGTLDGSFGAGGYVSPELSPQDSEWAYDIVRQPDGKLVLSGRAYSAAEGYRLLAVRFFADGTPDNTFNGSGYQTVDFDLDIDEFCSLALQPDGGIVLAASVRASTVEGDWGVARLNSNGTIDTSFSDDGFDVLDFNGHNDKVHDVVIQDDGKILLVGGAFVAGNGFNRAMVRYSQDGTLDPTFGTDGRYVLPPFPSGHEQIWSAALQDDGRLVVFAGDVIDYQVERYLLPAMPLVVSQTLEVTDDDTPSLTLTIDPASIEEGDGAAATTGTVTRNSDTSNALVVTLSSSDTSEAAVPVTVTIPAGQASADFPIDAVDDAVIDGTQLVNITASVQDPVFDSTFGTGGVAPAGIEQNDLFNELDLAVQADGKILTLGDDSDDANAWRLARLNADGSPDTTFGTNGAVATAFPDSEGGRPYAMVLQPDGKIVVVGEIVGDTSSQLDWGLARYTTTGQLDTGFGSNGLVLTEFSDESRWLVDVDLAPDGTILVAGASLHTSRGFQLARFLADGTLDTTFGSGGIVIEDLGPSNNIDRAFEVAVQPDGKVLLAGKAEYGSLGTQYAVYRYHADGTPDLSFANDGLREISFGDEFQFYDLQELIVLPDGRILLGGYLRDVRQHWSAVARLLANGDLDPEFNGGGRAFHFGTSTSAFAMSLDDNQRIVLAGRIFSGPPTYTDMMLTRMNPDGTIDTGFGNNGLTVISPSTSYDEICTTRFQPDGLLAALFVADGEAQVARFGMGPVHETGHAQVAVLNDDVLPEVEFTAAAYELTEAEVQTNLVTLARTGDTRGTSQVRVEITGGTATAAVDYGDFPFPMTVTFGPHETTKTVEFFVWDDPWHESDEDIEFQLTAISNAAIGDQDNATFVIVDNDPLALFVEIDRDEMAEQIGTSTATAYRNTTVGELTVKLESSDLTEATVPGWVTFADGESEAPFIVTALDDDEQDGTQTVTVTVREPGYISGSDTIDVTDDESPGFAPGNLWVTNYTFDGESHLGEYTLDGTLLQDILVVHNGNHEMRDIMVDRDLLVNIYAGMSNPVFAKLQVATKALEQFQIPGLAAGRTSTYGGIAVLRQYVYLSDQGKPGGIVRIDTSDSTYVRFSEGTDTTDVAIGHDGLLYACDFDSIPDVVHVFDPYSLAQLRTIELPSSVRDHRGMAVDAKGDLFATSWNGDIYHYDPAGVEQNQLDAGPRNLGDIDIRADGTVAVGTRSHGVLITDLTLADFSSLDMDDGAGMHFVAFTDPFEFAAPGLTLTIVEAEVTEGGTGSLVTVTRNTEPIGDLVVELSSSDADQVTMPSEITIPDGAVAATFTVAATDDPLLDGPHTVTLTARADGYAEDSDTVDVLDDDVPLAVMDVAGTPSGFRVQFNRPFDPADLNLFDVQRGVFGPADVTLMGDQAGQITGSLVLGADSLVFMATGGTLPADDYTVTLRSAANGFRDLGNGELLDGDDNGTPGGDCVRRITLAAPQPVVVGLPDFMRGPGQEVHVPPVEIDDGDDTPGLPLRISDADGVTSVELTIQYDPELLTIDGAVIGPDAPALADVDIDLSVPGLVSIDFASNEPLAAGPAEFVTLSASVPSTASAGASHVLDVTIQRVNNGAVSATADDAVHLVGLFGDTTGNGEYSGLDAQRVARVSVNLDGGFEAYPCTDPVVVADVTGNGDLSGLDAQRIAQEAVRLDPPEIPDLPQPQRHGLPPAIASGREGEAPAEPQSTAPAINVSLAGKRSASDLTNVCHWLRQCPPLDCQSQWHTAGLNIPQSAIQNPHLPDLLAAVLDEIDDEEDATWDGLALAVRNAWDEATNETRMEHGF